MPRLKVQTVGELWDSYRADVIPRNASAVQVNECKRAFYAGATAHQACVYDACSLPDQIAEIELDKLRCELAAFAVSTYASRPK